MAASGLVDAACDIKRQLILLAVALNSDIYVCGSSGRLHSSRNGELNGMRS
jgi:hypothetical protein